MRIHYVNTKTLVLLAAMALSFQPAEAQKKDRKSKNAPVTATAPKPAEMQNKKDQ